MGLRPLCSLTRSRKLDLAVLMEAARASSKSRDPSSLAAGSSQRGSLAKWTGDFAAPQIFAARWSDGFSIVVDEHTPKKGALDPTGELKAFEWRVALLGGRVGSAAHEAFVRIDEREVGIVAGSDVALPVQAEPPGRIPAQKLRHA